MKSTSLAIEQIQRMADILRVIGHPTRLQIIELLEANEASVGDLGNKLSIEQSLLSHHLTKMKDIGILRSRREGKNTFYALREQNITSLFGCMEKCSTLF